MKPQNLGSKLIVCLAVFLRAGRVVAACCLTLRGLGRRHHVAREHGEEDAGAVNRCSTRLQPEKRRFVGFVTALGSSGRGKGNFVKTLSPVPHFRVP